MSFSSRVTDRPSFFSLSAPSKLLSLRLSSTFLRFDTSLVHNLLPLLPGVRLSSTSSRFDASWSHNLQTSWFVKTKEFVLQMQNETETLDLLFFPGEKLQNTFDRRQANRRCYSPPYALKCLSLLDYAALMDDLFWSFSPKILSISCNFPEEGQDECLLEFLCKTFEAEKLMTTVPQNVGGSGPYIFKGNDTERIKQKVPLRCDALSKAIQIIQKMGQAKMLIFI